jgi:hypothetical protein
LTIVEYRAPSPLEIAGAYPRPARTAFILAKFSFSISMNRYCGL